MESRQRVRRFAIKCRIYELKDMGFNIADTWIENVNRYGD